MTFPTYALILAGGHGTRFWPKSRRNFSKQLCSFSVDGLSMLEHTLRRLDGVVPPERRIVITQVSQEEQIRAVVGRSAAHVLAEPEGKNTAVALILGALAAERLGGERVRLLCFSADHCIGVSDDWYESLHQAEVLADEYLVLFGVRPRGPATGYGYIERGDLIGVDGFATYEVVSFREKPDLDLAKSYLANGNYYWNAGIFAWDSGLFLDEAREFLPRVVELLESGNLDEVYPQLPNVPVDCAILEFSAKCAVIEAPFVWDDLGHWGALGRNLPSDDYGNVRHGLGVGRDNRDCVFYSDGPLVAGIGLQDMVVVAAGGAVLVCPRSRSQEVKDLVGSLGEEGLEEFL